MMKQCITIAGFSLLVFLPLQTVKADPPSKVEGFYVTTEDIVSDIVFPTIDKRVIKEYGAGTLFDWNWQRIDGIKYNDNHSYDVTVRIQISSKNLENNKEDLVTVRISPSCDSEKINKFKCNHDFKIEILEYKHLSE